MVKRIFTIFSMFLIMAIFLVSCSKAVSVINANINDKGELILEMSDGTTKNLGVVKGEQGEKGDSEIDRNPQGLDFYLLPDGTYSVSIGTATHLNEIVIPDMYNGKNVTAIQDFSDGEFSIITIPETINYVYFYAFGYADKLVEVINKSSVDLSDIYGLNPIEVHSGESKIVDKNGYLFYTYDGVNYLVSYKGADTELTLPESYDGQAYQIYKFAFKNNFKITSITIPDSVTSIGYGAFRYCRELKSITIGSGVKSIDWYAFEGCTKLEKLNYNAKDAEVELGSSIFDHEVTMDVIIGDSVIKIPQGIFSGKNIKTLTIGNSVTSIGEYAFSGCTGLTSITIPNSVTSIGNYAFDDCTDLISVTVGSGVASIGEYAFSGCTDLISVTVGSGVASIGEYAFAGCTGLISVTVGSGVATIGESAFEGCFRLYEVINKSSLTINKGSEDYGYIAKYALEVHNGTSKIVDKDGYLFYTIDEENYLVAYTGTDTELVLPANYNGQNYQIYDRVFRGSDITSITIPETVTTIGNSAFSGCIYLTSVTIPDSVTSIGIYAFYNCTGLTSVTIPNSVTSIGDRAFYYCIGLTSIKYRGTEEQWNAISKSGYWINHYNYTITYNYTGE